MSYKALFAIAAALDLEIEQMDVKTAFLYGCVQEDIFVEQPHGLNDNSGRVCKLNKALFRRANRLLTGLRRLSLRMPLKRFGMRWD
jgi:hypothetical protein